MSKYYLLPVDLQLFSDGGAAAGAGDGAADTGAAPVADTAKGRKSGVKSGALASVVYGRKDETDGSAAGSEKDVPMGEPEGQKEPEVKTTSSTLEERKAAFDALINGDYRDEYDRRVTDIVQRRLRGMDGLQKQVEAQAPVMDMLMQRYKIADGDVSKLLAAVERDDAYWSQAADEAGLSIEQYRQMQKLQRENEQFRRLQEAQSGQQRAQQQIAQWQTEAEAMKTDYPGFDLTAEVRNPQFMAMLKNGVPLRHAYEVFHLDEIKTGAMQQAARTAEKNVVDGIRAKGARPPENGTSAQSGVVVRSDVSRLTKADRAEIAKRAMRGDEIKF